MKIYTVFYKTILTHSYTKELVSNIILDLPTSVQPALFYLYGLSDGITHSIKDTSKKYRISIRLIQSLQKYVNYNFVKEFKKGYIILPDNRRILLIDAMLKNMYLAYQKAFLNFINKSANVKNQAKEYIIADSWLAKISNNMNYILKHYKVVFPKNELSDSSMKMEKINE